MEIRWYYDKQGTDIEKENLLVCIRESDDSTISTDLYCFLEILIVESFLYRMKNTKFTKSIGFEVVVIVVYF